MPSSAPKASPAMGFSDAFQPPVSAAVRRRGSVLDTHITAAMPEDANSLGRRSSLTPAGSTLFERRRSLFTQTLPAQEGVSSARRSSVVQQSIFVPTPSTLRDDGDVLPSTPSSPETDGGDPLLKLTPADIRRPSFVLTTASTLTPAKSSATFLLRPLPPRLLVATLCAASLLVLTALFSPSSLPFSSSIALRKASRLPPLEPAWSRHQQLGSRPSEDFKLKELIDLIARDKVIPAGERLARQNGGKGRKRLSRIARRSEHGQLVLTSAELAEVKKARGELLWGKSDVELKTAVIEHNSSFAHESTVIFIHGLAQDVPQHAFLPNSLWQNFPSTRWVMPQAPKRDISLFSIGTDDTVSTTAWFNMGTIPYDTEKDHDDEAFFTSTRQLNAVIARERALLIQRRRRAAGMGGNEELSSAADFAAYGTEDERKWASRRIVLSGFSQGGAMSLLTGLTHEYELGGLAVFSTILPLREYMSRLTYDLKRTSLPIYWAHGTVDPYLTYSDALTCLSLLAPSSLTLPYPVGTEPSDLYLTHPAFQLGMKDVQFSTQWGLPHATNDVELVEVDSWLKRVLPAASV
ncbi:hypothetical protein JCM6882_009673 [Rhodosporidiobolus microsporus]